MEEPNDSPVKTKWHGRLAVLFLLLFAVFWSLDSFFFWILFGLSAYFVFFAFYSSGIKISMFDRQGASKNPYPSDRFSTDPSVVPNQILLVRKVIRMFVIGFGAIFFFLIVVGIFSSKDNNNDVDNDANTESVQVEASEPTDSDKINEYTNKGNDFFSQAQYDSALKYYDKSLAIDRDNQYSQYNKALVYYMKKEYRRSIPLVKKCLREHPDYNEAWWLLGDDYFAINNYDSAIFCLEKAYTNDYRDSGFLEQMAETYLKKGNRSMAKEFYLKVLEQDTTKAEVYRNMAELDPGNADRYRKKANALEQSTK